MSCSCEDGEDDEMACLHCPVEEDAYDGWEDDEEGDEDEGWEDEDDLELEEEE